MSSLYQYSDKELKDIEDGAIILSERGNMGVLVRHWLLGVLMDAHKEIVRRDEEKKKMTARLMEITHSRDPKDAA